MPATPRRLEVTAKDLEGKPEFSGGTYAEIDVPDDYEIFLADVSDYDKRDEGKTHGWEFLYQIETSTGPADFRVFLSLSKSARWKIIEVFAAHGIDLEVVGIHDADPNAIVGETIGGHVDFPRDKDGEPSSTYREIQAFFPLVEAPEDPEVGGTTEVAADIVADEPEVL